MKRTPEALIKAMEKMPPRWCGTDADLMKMGLQGDDMIAYAETCPLVMAFGTQEGEDWFVEFIYDYDAAMMSFMHSRSVAIRVAKRIKVKA